MEFTPVKFSSENYSSFEYNTALKLNLSTAMKSYIQSGVIGFKILDIITFRKIQNIIISKTNQISIYHLQFYQLSLRTNHQFHFNVPV